MLRFDPDPPYGGTCPEQYDVLGDDGTQVAYLRVRHGRLQLRVPDAAGSVLYECPVGGPGGCIPDEDRAHVMSYVISLLSHYVENMDHATQKV